MHHSSLRLAAEGAGGRGCKSYPVHVMGECSVVAAAEPGEVHPVFPWERFLRGVDRGWVGA